MIIYGPKRGLPSIKPPRRQQQTNNEKMNYVSDVQLNGLSALRQTFDYLSRCGFFSTDLIWSYGQGSGELQYIIANYCSVTS